MKIQQVATSILFAAIAQSEAFSASPLLSSTGTLRSTTRRQAPALFASSVPYYATENPNFGVRHVVAALDEAKPDEVATTLQSRTKPKPIKKKVAKSQTHTKGILSPLVLGAKQVMGVELLNKFRSKGISLHSDVIASFVKTADTDFGNAILTKLFGLIDQNRDGTISEDELAAGFRKLGFTWLKEKQVKGILARADKDENAVLDFQEFVNEAPKTLKTNLIKLAKKNGGELGLLV